LIFDKRNDLHQFISFEDQGIGILEKNGLSSPIQPGTNGAKGVIIAVAAIVNTPDDRIIHPTGIARFPGKRPDFVGDHPGLPYVLFYLLDAAELEFSPLIGAAKGALVPRTIPRYPNQQAFGFAGRPDGPLFER
jgi:hypothetical protein